MEVKIQLIIEAYKEELARVTNENVLLRAQLRQLQNELESNNEGCEE